MILHHETWNCICKVCLKAFVSDTCLSQPPLLILPGDTVSDCVEPAMAKLAVGEAPRSLIYYTEKRQFTLT